MTAETSGRAQAILSRSVEQQAELWPRPTGPSVWSDSIGRPTRLGDWEDQGRSTYGKVVDLLAASRFEQAASYVDLFVGEAEIIYGFFRQLIPDAITLLVERGLQDDELVEMNAAILNGLASPDGRPFEARRLWVELLDLRRQVILACGAERVNVAGQLVEQLRQAWCDIHDRDVDHLCGLLIEAANRFDEASLGDFWRTLMQPTFRSRYTRFDTAVTPWDESLPVNVYLAFEVMRGHLTGDRRHGEVEFREDGERFSLSFLPCGSGGRTLPLAPVHASEDQADATAAPVGVTRERHDFAWNKKGVCYYCIDCCVVMQQMPIDAFGYPVRVVEPPTYPSPNPPRCTWHIYKDPTTVPSRFYEEVGRKKPTTESGG